VVEEPVHIKRIHAECWGTPDGWRYDPGEGRERDTPTYRPGRLVVGDYKYGHRFVDAFENLQLGAGYAAGVLAQLGISTGDDETIVELIIVQPRAFSRGGPVQRWQATPFKLNALVTRARDAVASALGPNPQANTGPHCKDCRARAICGTLRASAAHVVDFSGAADPHELDTGAACVELAILDDAAARLDARRTGLAAQVEAAARSGERTPGWALEPGAAKLDWLPTVTVDEVRAFGAVMGVELTKPAALITPTQALKKLHTTEQNMLAFAERKPGGVKLKRDDGTAARMASRWVAGLKKALL
jgi:hypothetical protein